MLGACGGLLDSLLLGLDSLLLGRDEVLLFGYLVDEEVDEALDSGTVGRGAEPSGKLRCLPLRGG